jgi:hypothetical protein
MSPGTETSGPETPGPDTPDTDTPETDLPGTRRLWLGAYAALLRVLPRSLREPHGQAMLALYARDLDRRRRAGMGREAPAALAGLADLVWRGVQERVAIERRAMGRHDLVPLRQLALTFVVACTLLTALMVAQAVLRRVPGSADQRAITLVLYSVPYTLGLTVPMAVFLAVLQVAAPVRTAPSRGQRPPRLRATA